MVHCPCQSSHNDITTCCAYTYNSYLLLKSTWAWPESSVKMLAETGGAQL